MPEIQQVYLDYTCHRCKEQYSNAGNLKRHLEDQEDYEKLPSLEGRHYNTKFIKFITKHQLRTYKNPLTRFPCASCKQHFEVLDKLEKHYEDCHLPKKHPELVKSFQQLETEEKWRLNEGKAVENTLYEFSKKCISDHPACSMIVNLDDPTLGDCFNEKEIQEIRQTNELPFISKMPCHLAEYINKYNLSNVDNLRQALSKKEDWETNYKMSESHDLDWIKYTVYSYVRLFESKQLERSQLETWYDRKVWSIIDNAFDDTTSIQVIRGEATSISSGLRKNLKRVIGSIEPLKIMIQGKKCDLIVRETKQSHEEAYGFGFGESGREYSGSKHLTEGNLIMPKVMKDMLDRLIINNDHNYKNMATFGIQTSGLTMTLLMADRPHRYITRITNIASVSFPSNVANFGKQVLPLIVLVWQFKQQILRVQKLLNTHEASQDASWLQTCLNTKSTTPVIPATSTSTEYAPNKRFKTV